MLNSPTLWYPEKKRKKNANKTTERENFQNGQNHSKALETDGVFFSFFSWGCWGSRGA
jgi:hypothetical protein